VAARILLDFDVEPEHIRNKVISALAGPREKRDNPRDERQIIELLTEIRELLKLLVQRRDAKRRGDRPPA
jgi:hypothetical protein